MGSYRLWNCFYSLQFLILFIPFVLTLSPFKIMLLRSIIASKINSFIPFVLTLSLAKIMSLIIVSKILSTFELEFFVTILLLNYSSSLLLNDVGLLYVPKQTP